MNLLVGTALAAMAGAVPMVTLVDASQIGALFAHGAQVVDPDRQLPAPLGPALFSGCMANQAISAAIMGDTGAFTELLDKTQKDLQAAAERLRALAKRGTYKRDVNLSRLKLTRASHDLIEHHDGNAVLFAIADLASDSAARIAAMLAGQEDTQGFVEIAQNQSDISQLIIAFYTRFS